MPVKAKKIGKKFRVVESSTEKVATRGGKAIDGGGHTSKAKAVDQVQAVNISMRKKRRK